MGYPVSVGCNCGSFDGVFFIWEDGRTSLAKDFVWQNRPCQPGKEGPLLHLLVSLVSLLSSPTPLSNRIHPTMLIEHDLQQASRKKQRRARLVIAMVGSWFLPGNSLIGPGGDHPNEFSQPQPDKDDKDGEGPTYLVHCHDSTIDKFVSESRVPLHCRWTKLVH
jgi:hypothetical protein